MSTVISVENLSKVYRLGVIGSTTLREDLSRAWARLRGRPDPMLKVGTAHSERREGNVFWALRDINFEVKQGEVLGIIGRNGAGKSTLLKILSRVTAPTSGSVKVKGRIASLLEVGTGFNPELTGRENVFLNSAILGMPRSEIRKRFDEIVDFSGVEDFIDTPVKRYSGGMYVRLAFAVAAHLEPDILILDEVLAVGDAAFQRKCLGKMGETAKQGRTVLFVSHSMPAVQRLCEKAILLENGDLEAQGDTPSIIATYLHTAAPMRLSWSRTHPPGSPCYFRRIWLGDELRNPLELASTGGSCHVYIDFVLTERCHGLQLTLGLSTDTEEQIFNTAPQDAGIPLPTEPGCYLGCVVLPADLLMPRPYVIRAALWHPHLGVLDGTEALRFSPHETASLANNLPHGRPGLIALKCSWSLSMLTEAVVQRAAK